MDLARKRHMHVDDGIKEIVAAEFCEELHGRSAKMILVINHAIILEV